MFCCGCTMKRSVSPSIVSCSTIHEIIEFIENERGLKYPVKDSTIISEISWVENYEIVDSTIGYVIYDDLVKRHREANKNKNPVTCCDDLVSGREKDQIYMGFSTPVVSPNGDFCMVYIETYDNPLSASGTVYIFELSGIRKKSIKGVRYRQVLWVS
jgi:hypothetical protein